MGLSKGTLGLKFMNRQAPTAPPGAAPPAAPGPSTSNSTSAPADSVRSAGSAGSTKASTGTSGGSKQAAAGTAGAAKLGGAHAKATLSRESTAGASTNARTASRPAVVHESSLLSFPLLSTLNRTSAASSSAATTMSSMASSYSSMPLTSAMVSGRRSFGGANIEIEKLNDPSSHQAPPPGADDKSKSRRPKKGDRDAALVPSVRRGGTLSGSKAAKRTADLDQARRTESVRPSGPEGDEAGSGVGGKKKRRKTDENGVASRWEVDDDEVSFSGRRTAASGSTSALAARKADFGSLNAPAGSAAAAGFARPAGFDGLKKKKQAATAPKKEKGNAVEGDYQWTKRGETREWDQGKDDDSDEDESSEGDEELMVSGDSEDSDDDDDDSEMDEAILDDERKFAEAADQAASSSASRSRKGRSMGKPAQRGRGGR